MAACPQDTAQQVGAECLEVVGLLGGGGSRAPAPGVGRWASPLCRGSQVLRTTCVGEGSYLRRGFRQPRAPREMEEEEGPTAWTE